MIRKTNLHKELLKVKAKDLKSKDNELLAMESLYLEAMALLDMEDKELLVQSGFNNALDSQQQVVQAYRSKQVATSAFDELTSRYSFQLTHIMAICLDFRLLMLPSNSYQKTMPASVVGELKSFKKKVGEELFKKGKFFIVARKETFFAGEGPCLLFCKLTEDLYYLVGQWGKPFSGFSLISSKISSCCRLINPEEYASLAALPIQVTLFWFVYSIIFNSGIVLPFISLLLTLALVVITTLFLKKIYAHKEALEKNLPEIVSAKVAQEKAEE